MIFDQLDPTVALDQNRQLVRLRWIAATAVAGTVFVASSLGLVSDSATIWVVIGVMACVNIALTAVVRLPGAARHGRRILVAQLTFDMIALNLLVHCAGGIQNPFAFFYVFLALIAGMTCSPSVAWALAAGVFVLFGGTAVIEYAGWLPHHPLNLHTGVEASGPRHGGAYLLGFLVAWGSVLFGVVAYATSTMARLSETARAERALRERLHQQERLALIGEVVAGVVHELSTPLNGVRNSFHALRRDPVGFLKHADILDLMEDALERMTTMSRRLLMLSREPEIARKPLSVNDVVERALEHLRGRIESSGATVECRRGAVPPILADEVALGEVVTNLVTNALDAVEHGGRVAIETSNGGAMAVIRVSDSGSGIPAAMRERLFQPFQTTKPLGRGTGLGLAISKRLVNAHGGTIDVESTGGTGTTVAVRVPLAGEAAA